MFRAKKVSRLTVNFTIVFNTSDKLINRKMVVAITAVLLPWTFISKPYWKAKPSKIILIISQSSSYPYDV